MVSCLNDGLYARLTSSMTRALAFISIQSFVHWLYETVNLEHDFVIQYIESYPNSLFVRDMSALCLKCLLLL